MTLGDTTEGVMLRPGVQTKARLKGSDGSSVGSADRCES